MGGSVPLALLASLVLLPAGAVAADDGFHGKTSQGQSMEFFLTSSGKLVQKAQAHDRITCANGAKATSGFGVGVAFGDRVRVVSGRYRLDTTVPARVQGVGAGRAHYVFKGAISGRTLKGTVRLDYRLESTTCTTGTIGYTLTRRRT